MRNALESKGSNKNNSEGKNDAVLDIDKGPENRLSID